MGGEGGHIEAVRPRWAQKDDLPEPCGPTMACVRVDFCSSAACTEMLRFRETSE